ncbi:MAG: hypothetical protein M3Y56_03365 [Armatimonadota bacterium]|nr:hypothetical protein [Armatimonadota bacterium]
MMNGKNNPSTGPDIHFADSAEARVAILDDRGDTYFSRLQSLEIAAKTGQAPVGATLDEQRAHLRSLYTADVLSFTAEEQEAFTWYIQGIYAALRKDYPGFASAGWRFIKTNGGIESGLPFTRGAYIVFSKSWVERLTLSRKKAATTLEAVSGMRVLIHEQCHVYQRSHPQLFAGLYTSVWGFVHAVNVQPNGWLQDRQVLNPDGTDIRWIYPIVAAGTTRWIWPLIILPGNPNVYSLYAIQAVAVEGVMEGDTFRPTLDPNQKPVLNKLSDVTEYVSAFEPATEIFHPNEIEADLFSWMVTEDIERGGNGTPSEPADVTAFRKWCRLHLV